MKPALAQGSFGEVPGNQAWCGGDIPESHRRPPTNRCPKDPARAEGSHPCGRSAVS